MRIFMLVVAMLMSTILLQGCFPLIAAGVGAGALSAADRRSTGAQIDDEAIELKISNRFKEQFGTSQYNVDVTSFNRRVLLTGEAASADVKNKLTEIAKSVSGVAGVTNEVTEGFSGSKAGDGLVTSNVKTRLLTNNEGRFSPNHIKVITDKSIVYLMGIVTPAEGDAAAEVARTSKGVHGVVKVFEYVDKVN